VPSFQHNVSGIDLHDVTGSANSVAVGRSFTPGQKPLGKARKRSTGKAIERRERDTKLRFECLVSALNSFGILILPQGWPCHWGTHIASSVWNSLPPDTKVLHSFGIRVVETFLDYWYHSYQHNSAVKLNTP
jgi:sterol desaturase/sphingolipid hydroxylase (fatty acid hydroxylase superfamily)